MKNALISSVILISLFILLSGCKDSSTGPSDDPTIVSDTKWTGAIDDPETSENYYITDIYELSFTSSGYIYIFRMVDQGYTGTNYHTYKVGGDYSANNNTITFEPESYWEYIASEESYDPLGSKYAIPGASSDSLHTIDSAAYQDSLLVIYREGEVFARLQNVEDTSSVE